MSIDNIGKSLSIDHARTQAMRQRIDRVNAVTESNNTQNANQKAFQQLVKDVNLALKTNNLQETAKGNTPVPAQNQNVKREIQLTFNEEEGELSVRVLDSDGDDVVRELDHQEVVNMLGEMDDYRGLVIDTRV